ncbi:nucleotide pyrophosphohydrolase [Psychrobacillus sp. FJAT-21963]|uniref:nucleotide pyrophosphohydrolase n=1 Tax=Psychrobacillus sp. FJAT-21963 TaxID=1712028 RepID=UPI0006F68842|nr:nucleotide pyrophosphohydrolase [Psychrobacillus sp. FJAT-21963]KQL37236.1 nucleotide pyrophosphohydrolase [Psychrobacillus sp. FJAT-21963]
MKELTEEILKFRDDRGWGGNHDARSLAISVSLEASELLEHFQWVSSEEAIQKDKQAIVEEAADVFIYLLQLANVLDIDLKEAAQQKLKKNAVKYPIRTNL